MKKQIKNLLLSILIFFSPITFVFSQDKYVDIKDRMVFSLESIFKFAPIYFIYKMIYDWYSSNETFATSLFIVLILNAVIGIRYHMKMRTLSIKEFIISTFTMLAMVLGVYLILRAFGNVMGHNVIGDTYMRMIEFITLLYPGSKVLQNIFILTNGKHPPLFVMKALYSYQKDGKIQQFISTMTGNNNEEGVSGKDTSDSTVNSGNVSEEDQLMDNQPVKN